MSILEYKLKSMGLGDDTRSYATRGAFPAAGDSDVLYLALDTGLAWFWNGTDYQAVGWNVAGTALLGPDGEIPIIKTEIAAFGSAAFAVATGLGTNTPIDMASKLLDTDDTLVDLVNNWVNVPTDATHCRIQANVFFATGWNMSRC